MKLNDLQITLDYFKTSRTWDYGEYKLLSSDIKNFNAYKSDKTIDLTIAQRILDVQASKALRTIKRDLDTKRILTIFSWADLVNTRFVKDDGLKKVIEGQLSGMITDGNKEIKQGYSYSGQGVDAGTDPSGYLISSDRIYKATEDAWYELQLDRYDVKFDSCKNSYSLIDNADATIKQVVAQVFLTQAQLDAIANNLKNDANFQANVKGKDGTNGTNGIDGTNGTNGIDGFIKTVGGIKDIDTTIHERKYFVLDMSGINGFGNEHGYVYIDSTGAISYEKTWEEIDKKIIAINKLEVTTPLSDDEIDAKLKVISPNPVDKEIAYVGSNTNWVIWTYSATDTKWSNSIATPKKTFTKYNSYLSNAEIQKIGNDFYNGATITRIFTLLSPVGPAVKTYQRLLSMEHGSPQSTYPDKFIFTDGAPAFDITSLSDNDFLLVEDV